LAGHRQPRSLRLRPADRSGLVYRADGGRGSRTGCSVGTLGGALLGGRDGAFIGAAAGGLLGAAAGGYVAQQKQKYASIEQRIAGERQITAEATATARSQTAASAARLQLVNAQLADLSAMQGDRIRARDTATVMLAGLQRQRTELETERKNLETRVNNQLAFIAQTEKDIGNNDPEKTAQLARWKADMPNMQAALAAMTTQISDVTVMETRVQKVRMLCC
jgi:chromosome segregation ATPase